VVDTVVLFFVCVVTILHGIPFGTILVPGITDHKTTGKLHYSSKDQDDTEQHITEGLL
jgi:hypothetical protein